MDIEKKMESVVETWNKKGELMPLLFKTHYQGLDTVGENLNDNHKRELNHFFHGICCLSIDVAMETMNKEIKKGIMKMDWDSDLSFIGKYLTDLYDSDGDMVQE